MSYHWLKNNIGYIIYLHLWYFCLVLHANKEIEKWAVVKYKVKNSIVDPIHDSIPLTELEYRIIDSKEFQRLRHVLQQSTAYQTFPSNTNTRFPHSLGVMHLAGKMLISSFSNSSSEVLRNIFEKLNQLVLKLEKNGPSKFSATTEGLEELLYNWSNKPAFVHNPIIEEELPFRLTEPSYEDEEGLGKSRHSDYFLFCVVYQAVRIGALVHDIGHMPLSHMFEHAIELKNPEGFDEESYISVSDKVTESSEFRQNEYTNKLNNKQKKQVRHIYGKTRKFEFHEHKGLFLFGQICTKLLNSNDAFDQLVVSLTKEILLSMPMELKTKDSTAEKVMRTQHKDYKFWGLFHAFFANDFVDADRLDYTMRDAYSSGMNFGSISISQLLENIVLRQSDVEGEHSYYIAWHTKATQQIESFFYQRYLGYQRIAFHHSVMKTNAIAKKIISIILFYSFNNIDSDIMILSKRMSLYDADIKCIYVDENKKECQVEGELFIEGDGIAVEFDDAWFRTLFTMVLQLILEKQRKGQDVVPERLKNLKLYLETYLHRKSSNIFTLWKSENEYSSAHKEIFQKCENEKFSAQLLEEKLHNKFNKYYKPEVDKIVRSIQNKFKTDTENSLHDLEVIAETYGPKIFNVGADTYPVIDLFKDTKNTFETPSPYLSGFQNVDHGSQNMNIYVIGHDIKTRKYASDSEILVIDRAREIIEQAIEEQINLIIEERLTEELTASPKPEDKMK